MIAVRLKVKNNVLTPAVICKVFIDIFNNISPDNVNQIDFYIDCDKDKMLATEVINYDISEKIERNGHAL